MKAKVPCAYLKECYLAEELKCYGYKTDCALYLKSNNEPTSEFRFHQAMDRLIRSARKRHEGVDQP